MSVLNGEADVDEVPKKGLIGLPFMQKAMQKQKAQTHAEATKMLQEIDGTKQQGTDTIRKSRIQFGGDVEEDAMDRSDSDQEGSQSMTNAQKPSGGSQKMPTLPPTRSQPLDAEAKVLGAEVVCFGTSLVCRRSANKRVRSPLLYLPENAYSGGAKERAK